MARRKYHVKEVARMTGITVRALHYYDDIGVLVPKGRTAGGYRLYDEEDLLRLQQILIGRELGLSLEEIRRWLDDPHFDSKQVLVEQKVRLQKRMDQIESMIRAVDEALAALDHTGEPMDVKKLFDGFDPSKYEDEVTQRWGATDAYRESRIRTKRYTADDWRTIQAEQAAIYTDAFAAMKAGKRPDDKEVMAIAERHRQSIERWFYPCSHTMHHGLAELYECDERFAANIDKYGVGLTTYLVAAIKSNAARHRC